MKKIKMIVTVLLACVLFLGGCSASKEKLKADSDALKALESDSAVSVDVTDDYIVFSPSSPTCAVIYLPSDGVEPQGFAWAAREIASKGYLVVILNKADMSVFDRLKAAFPSVSRWVASGFDDGAQKAAEYVSDNEDGVEALILYAWAPDEKPDLSLSSVKTLCMTGSEDGLFTADSLESTKAFLPEFCEYYVISGANHTQFNCCGDALLEGDNDAAVNKLIQQRMIVEYTCAFLKTL